MAEKQEKTVQVSSTWDFDFHGDLLIEGKKHLKMNGDDDGFLPYELLMSSLSGCFAATFEAVVKKMRLSYDKMEMDVFCKRQFEEPSFARDIKMTLVVYGADPAKHERFERALELSAKHCSVHLTLDYVAEFTHEIRFAD